MPNMSVKMTMTLDDMASSGLKKFMELIDTIGPKVTGLSNRINTLERSMNRVGSASQGAATDLGKFDTAAGKADASAASLGATISNVETIVRGFDGAVRALNGVVANLSTTLNGLANAANRAGAGMNSAAAGMATANNQLGVLHGRVTSVTDSLRGMAEAWAAVKLFEAGKASVSEASQFQQLEARVKALNLPPDQTREFIQKSQAMSKEMGFLSMNQAMETRLAAVGGLGRNTSALGDPMINNIIEKTLPAAIQAAQVLKMRGDESDLKDIVRNLYGVVEMRGQTSRPIPEMINTFDLIAQNNAATGGKLTTKDIETMMRQAKYGAGLMLSDEGFINLLAYGNQLKASGSGGGGGGMGVSQAGTAITQLVKLAEGGVRNKESVRLLSAMGLIDDAKVRDDSKTTSVNVGAGAFKYSAEMLRDPIGTATQILAPIFLKFTQDNEKLFYNGKDPKNAAAQDEAVTKLLIMLTSGQGGTNVGNLLAQSVLPGPASRIREEKQLTQQSKGVAASLEDLEKTFSMNVDKFQAALKTLEVALGTTLLPALTAFLEKAAEFVRWLDEVAQANPTETKLTMIALGLGAVALALSGLQRMFGIFTALKDFLTFISTSSAGLGAAATSMGAAWAAASGVIGTALAVLRVAISRIVPIAGAFLVGWDIGDMINSLEVGGRSIHEWATDFMGRMVTAFANGWARIKSFMGLITDAERERQISENNAKLGIVLDTKGKQYHAEGRIGPRGTLSADQYLYGTSKYSETPEEKLRRETQEAAAKIHTGKYGPLDKDANKIIYNPAADAAKQAARFEEEELREHNRVMAAEYANAKISIDDYYNDKKEHLQLSVEAEIRELGREKEALEHPARGRVDKAAVSRVNTDMAIKQMRLMGDLAIVEDQREKAHTELVYKGVDADRQADAVSGKRHEAEIKRLNERMDKLKQLFQINKMPEMVDKVEEARGQGLAEINVTENYRKIQSQLAVLKDQEKDYTAEVSAGTKTQYEAENEIYLLRKEEAVLLDDFIAKNQALAAASGDIKWVKILADMGQQAKAQMSALSPEVLKIKGVLESGFAGFFNNFAQGGMTLRKMFDGLFLSIERGLQNLVAQNLAQKLGQMIFGNSFGTGLSTVLAGSSGTAAGGGILAMLGFGKSPADAGISPADEASGSAALASWGDLISESFAVGSPRVPRDMIAQVHKDEMIVTARDAQGIRAGNLTLGGGGSGASVNATFVMAQPMDPRSQSQMATAVAQKLHNMIQRNA